MNLDSAFHDFKNNPSAENYIRLEKEMLLFQEKIKGPNPVMERKELLKRSLYSLKESINELFDYMPTEEEALSILKEFEEERLKRLQQLKAPQSIIEIQQKLIEKVEKRPSWAAIQKILEILRSN